MFFSITPLAQFSTAFTTIPEITYNGSRMSSAGPDTGLTFPDALFIANDGLFGPTLELESQAAIPVPGAMAFGLTGLALASIGMSRQRKSNRSN